MFYEETDINELLKCSYCSSRFDDLIKLLPCGNSICLKCSNGIEFKSNPETKDIKEFHCKICKTTHRTFVKQTDDNSSGNSDLLPNNLPLIKLMNEVKPKEIYRGEILRNFKLLANEIKQSYDSLDRLIRNADNEIRSYCIKLRNEVKGELEISIERLNKLSDDLIREIDEYEMELLDSLKEIDNEHNSGKNTNFTKEFNDLITDSIKFHKECELKLKKAFVDERDILKATKDAFDLKLKQEKLKKSFRGRLFNDKFLKFERSNSAKASSLQLGKLTLMDITDAANSSSSTTEIKDAASVCIEMEINKVSSYLKSPPPSVMYSSQQTVKSFDWCLEAFITSDKAHLGLNVYCNKSSLLCKWSVYAKVEIQVVNCHADKPNYSGNYERIFYYLRKSWGYQRFISLQKLLNPENGFYDRENDSIKLRALVEILSYDE